MPALEKHGNNTAQIRLPCFPGEKENELLAFDPVEEALQFRSEFTQEIDARIISNLCVPHLHTLYQRCIAGWVPGSDQHGAAIVADKSRSVEMQVAEAVIGEKRHLESVTGAAPEATAATAVVTGIQTESGIPGFMDTFFDDEQSDRRACALSVARRCTRPSFRFANDELAAGGGERFVVREWRTEVALEEEAGALRGRQGDEASFPGLNRSGK